MIQATIIADSIAPSNVRLTTFVLKYPRFIHSEFMTHRMFSRNASSSRAIPTATFIRDIKNQPAMPTAFTKNQKGMQATEVVEDQAEAERLWLEARDAMLNYVQKLSDLGVHKQHANRLLEPFQHMSVICTATDYANFFALRCHKDAQPEFKELAEKMCNAYEKNKPDEVVINGWHLPFLTKQEMDFLNRDPHPVAKEMSIKQSVARCARVSYNNHDGSNATLVKDIELYDRLAAGNPVHASPTEHQAMAIADPDFRSGNFRGWLQFRKTIKNENITEFQGHCGIVK